MNMTKAALAGLLAAVGMTVAAQPVPKWIFGQNLEHTRAAVQEGISAQLVRNRKFAGKPRHTGVSQEWERYGNGVFVFLDSSFTHHARRNGMWVLNEQHSQQMTSLDPKGEAGITQDKIALRAGVVHTFRVVARILRGGEANMVLRVKQDGKVIAEQKFHESAKKEFDWKSLVLKFTPEKTGYGSIEIGVLADRTCVVGAVSVMADDNFHGMRPDVVAQLQEIGTSIIRWPGGCFATDYRWRDGYIEDPDERAPVQSFTEIETQPYSYGYDQNDLSSDDILALCEKIGAEPFFTINVVHESSADAAEWVQCTKGKVKRWSLGNEIGYPHAPGPGNGGDYAKLVRPHAEALLKVDPTLRITLSGVPQGHVSWLRDAGVPLNDVAKSMAYHTYSNPGPQVFCTPVAVRRSYAAVQNSVRTFFDHYYRFLPRCPKEVRMALDEWNLWAAWYREDGPVDGLFMANMYHRFMKEWEKMGLELICYFQAVNENAIRVTPFESRLTSIGHAMRVMKDHVGREPVAAELPETVFATDAQDGSRYITCFNFQPYDATSFKVPAGGRQALVAGELLEPNGVATGARFVSKQPTVKIADDQCEIQVPPASIVAVRLGHR